MLLPDRSMSLPGRSDRRRSPSAGRPASASPSPIAASSTGPLPPIRGRMDAGDALARLAKASGLQVKKVGANSFMLVAAARQSAAPKPTPVQRLVRQAAQPPAGGRPGAAGHRRHRQQARYAVAAFPGPMVADRWRRVRPAGRARQPRRSKSRSVGFSSTHLGAGRNKLFIRGIADSSFSGPTQSPVGQYFGDMRTGYSGPDPDLKLVDMQSVEILEGPQGTLYGSGALGGIVLLKPNMPGLRRACPAPPRSAATVTWHGDLGYDASAVINAPFGENVALRAVAYHAREGGYIDNLATGEKRHQRYRRHRRPRHAVGGGGAGLVRRPGRSRPADRGRRQPICRRRRLTACPATAWSISPSRPISRWPAWSSARTAGPIRFRSTTGASWQDVDENFDASDGSDVRQLGQHSKARAVSNETRLWRPMADGYSWLVGFSSIVHRYEVDRDIDRQTARRSTLPGVENRVRETTVYGEVGAELRADDRGQLRRTLHHHQTVRFGASI